MPSHLVAAIVASNTSCQRTHQTTVAFCLRIRVCGVIAAGRRSLAVRVGVVRVVGSLIVVIGSLLRKLIRWWCRGVLLIIVLAPSVSILIWCWSRGLAVLEAALDWWAVAGLLLGVRVLVALLRRVAGLLRGILLLRRMGIGIMVSTLRRSITLARCGRTILVLGILIVLIVGVRHCGVENGGETGFREAGFPRWSSYGFWVDDGTILLVWRWKQSEKEQRR
jgi:hypothetical protein